MATRRASSASAKRVARKKASKKKVAKRPSSKMGEICFPAEQSLSPKQIRVFDLKKGGKDLTLDELRRILKKTSRSKVGYVVFNSPFKLKSSASSVLPSRD